jgi:hypothetical protein
MAGCAILPAVGLNLAAQGARAVTDRSLLLTPPPGTTSVRIPYELVIGAEVDRSPATGEPRAMIVRSCLGRFDIFTFLHQQAGKVDLDATSAAAARLKERVTAFQVAADN